MYKHVVCNAMNEPKNYKLSPEISEQISKLSKISFDVSPLSENIRIMAEKIKQVSANIPKFEIPNFDHFKLEFPKIDFPNINILNSELLLRVQKLSKLIQKSNENPELHFVFISNLEFLNLNSSKELKSSLITGLNEERINEKEELLNKNLTPYLEELGIENLWFGANYALDSKSNPDKLRHCLISLRTILEYLIDKKLAPIEKLKNSSMFKNEFRKYHLGKQKLEFVKIKRKQKIEYFTSKIQFGVLEEFTKNEIQFVCDCYSILCNVHQPNIGINENQVRSLKVKTGITIWLLAYINKIIEN
jgi:hypothetical protein